MHTDRKTEDLSVRSEKKWGFLQAWLCSHEDWDAAMFFDYS